MHAIARFSAQSQSDSVELVLLETRSFVRSVEFPVNRMVNETNERNEPVRFVRESVRLSATVNSTELGGVIRESFVRSA